MDLNHSQKIVILDRDRQRRNMFHAIVRETGGVPFFFDKPTTCLDNVVPISPDIVIAGQLPKDQALRMIVSLKHRNHGMPVLLVSADSAVQHFVDQNEFHGVTVLEAGCEPWELQNALVTLMHSGLAAEKLDGLSAPVVIGRSRSMIKLKNDIDALCHINQLIFVKGEPGTGKELIVRSIYCKSPRKGMPFVKIDLEELSRRTTCEALFGGNESQPGQPGLNFRSALSAAAGGVLLLDKIDALPGDFQACLLNYLDDENTPAQSRGGHDVSLILTGRDSIDEQLAAGVFRKDLYYRINALTLHIPPLRARVEDIGLLADFFADECCVEIGKAHFDFSESMKNLFINYHWPGNVRELRDAVRAAVTQGSERHISEGISKTIQKGCVVPPTDTPGAINRLIDLSGLTNYLQTQKDLSLRRLCTLYTERIEKKLIRRTLERTRWNRRQAARRLHISYKSILNKIKQYKLVKPA